MTFLGETEISSICDTIPGFVLIVISATFTLLWIFVDKWHMNVLRLFETSIVT